MSLANLSQLFYSQTQNKTFQSTNPVIDPMSQLKAMHLVFKITHMESNKNFLVSKSAVKNAENSERSGETMQQI